MIFNCNKNKLYLEIGCDHTAVRVSEENPEAKIIVKHDKGPSDHVSK
jgi:hypothetical protein